MITPLGHGFALVVSESVASELEALRRAREAFALAIPAALLIAAVGAYILARRGLAPVGDIVETASRIEAENLSTRIPVARHDDEIGRLGAVLNALFDRLERSFAQQRQLIADTSHELRTPVTIIRSEAEVALSRERDPADYKKALEIVRSEAAHLTHLIEGVLMLARADAQQIRIDRHEFSLKDVIDESVRTAETLGRSRTIRLAANSEGPMPMVGDAELVRRMMLNLLDNAIKFSDSGGDVDVRAHRDGARYVITVSDSGHGIPAEDQPQIFDRFFRSDRVRGRDGSGLGLPIVKWIAEAHGGDARLLRSTASGSVFEVTLQGAPSDAALGS
ncbi:MAG TPA: ATP-binding protein [Thermoanaerobaculia bacterium]|nr:ATP-binding protein [Thermoanaerobaculia bacterium]